MARAEWGSRLGFILAAAGSAVGLGAIWKFPYVAAQNGGGAFLLIFLVIVFTLGISLMIAEMAVGASTRKSPVGAYRKLGGKWWSGVGYIGVLCGFLILSFYSVVGGWTIAYIIKSIEGSILTADPVVLSHTFDSFIADPVIPLWYHAVFMGLTAGVILAGVQKGIERVSKYLMVMLFLLILILIARGLTLHGALDGVVTFLHPDFGKVTPAMIIEAMGLAFFSMSLGMGCMITYGSYASGETAIPNSAGNVIGLTTLICFLSGLMVFPAIFVFGFNPAAGPGLTFITMPAVFSQMSGGQLFGILFFFLLFVAALTSSVSLMEVVVSFFIDEFRFPRMMTTVIMSILMFVLGIGASLSLGVWKNYTLFGKNLFGLLDYVSSNLIMPFGGIMIAILVGWKAWPVISARLTRPDGTCPVWLPLFKFFCRFIAPVLIFVILLQNL
ncbi:sodium-dependent transporter [Oxalobacter aliiformigenes]|uniref:sodium-dependent transporter n=1 Tax=Oxalobacter aliiformigenes TaxID=2946593 RepID=UPI0022AE64A1|nr:sodium-dependent transporter [Oxalobacter aliiformigenes]MCZ4065444.1 sodium-dependent transporter [Oxalobacter aliiformigenes]WAV99022.1 sodium-dependent transporter [Oxalobacter aliiformigenes]